MNNTFFSDDRFSDQSVRTSRNFERNLKNTENLCRNPQLHQKPALLPRKTKRAKELRSQRSKLAQSAENFTSPNKNPNERWKTRNY